MEIIGLKLYPEERTDRDMTMFLTVGGVAESMLTAAECFLRDFTGFACTRAKPQNALQRRSLFEGYFWGKIRRREIRRSPKLRSKFESGTRELES